MRSAVRWSRHPFGTTMEPTPGGRGGCRHKTWDCSRRALSRCVCGATLVAGPGFRRSGVITVSDGGNLAAFSCTKGADTSGLLGHAFIVVTQKDSDGAAVSRSPADSVVDAVRRAGELIEDGETKAARALIEAAIKEHSQPACPDLLWVLADVEFADGDPETALCRLRDAAQASGDKSGSASRQIRTLSDNRLRREALDVIESLDDDLRRDPLVRDATGRFFIARGCVAHAFDGYGRRSGLPRFAKLCRRLAWLASGGPLRAVRRRMREWEEAKLLSTLRRTSSHLQHLDQVAGIDDKVRAQLLIRIENVRYVFNLRFARYQALAPWATRLSSLVVLPIWLVLFLIAGGVHFISGTTSAAWGSAVSAAVVLAAALISFGVAYVCYTLGLSSVIRVTWRRLVIFAAIVALFETAIGESYDHQALPAAGWWSWVVFGLVAAPVVAACGMTFLLLGSALAWWHINDAKRADCQAALLDTALLVIDGLDTPARQRDYAMRLRWAVELEDAATLLTKNLVPPSYLRYLSSRDWLAQRMAGWAEALYDVQRKVLAPNSGSHNEAQKVLRHEIKCLATGDLGSLPWRRPPQRPPRRVTLRRQALAVVRAFVVAALPLAVVLAAQPLVHLSSPVFNWARIAAGIWALLYVVITLDPAIGDKIDTARSLVDAMRDSRPSGPTDIRDR
jgi:hypothetical protein